MRKLVNLNEKMSSKDPRLVKKVPQIKIDRLKASKFYLIFRAEIDFE